MRSAILRPASIQSPICVGAVAMQVGLMLGDHARAPIPMDKVIAQELEIYGSHGMQAFRYKALMDMLETGKLQPQRLVGKEIALEEAPAALMAMDRFEGTGINVITRFEN
jgi:alcohol dehydrogenase